MRKSVNRSLKDKSFDYIDHALGRPVHPMGDNYRNFFCISLDSKIGKEMDASPYWDQVSSSDGGVTGFSVNEEGRKALCRHLVEIGDKHKSYDVYIDARKIGLDPSNHPITVIAESPGKAKAKAWHRLSDVFDDITFVKFMKAISSVKVAQEIDLDFDDHAPAPAP